MVDFTLGLDSSKWQGEMNWLTASNAGAKFAFIRGGSITNEGGVPYVDDQFLRNAQLAPSFMPIGTYWYFRPQWNAIKQADYFLSWIKPFYDAGLFKLLPVCDVETTGGMTRDYIRDQVKVFCQRVIDVLGLDHMIVYTRGSWWNPYVTDDPFFSKQELWVARYSDWLTHPGGDGYYQPKSWEDWIFWQWSADANGRGAEFGAKSLSIDLNRFNGDQAAFDKYIDKEPEVSVIHKTINIKHVTEEPVPANVYLSLPVPVNETWTVNAISGITDKPAKRSELRIHQSGLVLPLAIASPSQGWLLTPASVTLNAGDKIEQRVVEIAAGATIQLRAQVSITTIET